MPFQWHEFLELAEFLNTGEGGFTRESALRSAVSRAYYAAFCEARRHAVSEMGYPANRDAKDHELLRGHYSSQKMTGVANRLDRLRQWRNMCDYDAVVHNAEIVCNQSLSEAHGVVDMLRKK